MSGHRKLETIDLTPTWEQALTAYARMLPSMDATGQAIALEELARAGRLLDKLLRERKS